MHRALFMAHQHMGDAFDLEQRVIDRQHRAAGITENMCDALIAQRLNHHLGARQGDGGAGGGRGGGQCIVLVHRDTSSK